MITYVYFNVCYNSNNMLEVTENKQHVRSWYNSYNSNNMIPAPSSFTAKAPLVHTGQQWIPQRVLDTLPMLSYPCHHTLGRVWGASQFEYYQVWD